MLASGLRPNSVYFFRVKAQEGGKVVEAYTHVTTQPLGQLNQIPNWLTHNHLLVEISEQNVS